MNYTPPGTFGVLRLLAKTSLLRLLRAAKIRQGQRARKPGARVATQRKRGDALMLLMIVMLPVFAFQSLMMTCQAVQRLATAMQHTAAAADTLLVDTSLYELLARPDAARDEAALAADLERVTDSRHPHPPTERIVEHFRRRGLAGFERAPAPPPFALVLVGEFAWPNQAAADAFTGASALLLLLLFAMLLAIGFGGANTSLAGGEWMQVWLATFPVATRSLILARALEYSLVQFFPWLTFCPLLLQVLRAQGQPGAWWIAIAATLLLTLLTGSLRLWTETWLRLTFSLRTLRSIQGVCTLLALGLMALVFSVGLGEHVPEWFLDVGRVTPAWLQWLPAAWPVALARSGSAAALPGVLVTVAVFVLACRGTSRLLAHGVMRSGGVDPGTRGKAGHWAKGNRRLGVVGKDLAMLLRDRNFLVQTLLVPVFVIGMQLVVNPGLGRVHGKGVAMLAYGIGIYSLIGGCFQVLSAEGRALWMLYSLPVTVAEVLRRKTRIWAAAAVGFSVAALLVFSLRAGTIDVTSLLPDLLFVGAGVFCAAHIAAGISILGTDPAADYVPRQPKARHVYLYFFFAGTYFLGLQTQDLGPRTAALLVFATLSFAIWQRACDRVPWLLDPVDEHRTTIGVYDGGAAVMVFFALQLLAFVILTVAGQSPGLQSMFLAFSIAGTITVVLFSAILSLRGVPVLASLGLRWHAPPSAMHSVLAGAGIGLLAGGLALGYLHLARMTDWIELPTPPTGERTALVLLAVLAAPLVEEVLFRGLLFQGLLRSVGLPFAVLWSAAVFAAVHPMPSWPPVFALGIATALVFHRSRFLPAAIAVHAAYNLVVVALQP